MPGQRRWILTVDPDCSLDTLTKALEAQGCRIESVLAEIGVITISADADDAQGISNVPGVLSVEADRQIDIGPPDGSPGW
jgi:hypothetical protein